jgi:cobalt/nickel transport system ATP-binding protein
LIEIKNLSYDYPDGSPGLSEISLSVFEGDSLALLGANGSGKSTLLMILAGCFKPSSGEIFFRGAPVVSPEVLRGAAGMVFQSPDDQMFMPTVLDDVAFGLAAKKTGAAEAKARAAACLEKLGIGRLASRPPHRISGGEKRLAALAGILVTSPEIILLDEPTSSLDPRARREITALLKSLAGTKIISTHDFGLARETCSRAVILRAGSIAASGETNRLLSDEKSLEVYGL